MSVRQSAIRKNRAIVFTLGILVAAVVLLGIEWMVIKAAVDGNPVQVFSIVGIITAVVAGTLIGRAARPWLHQKDTV